MAHNKWIIYAKERKTLLDKQ